MTGRRCTWLLAALLFAGTTPEADGFQGAPEDPRPDVPVERDPAVIKDLTDPNLTKEAFSRTYASLEAEWNALVSAEQAKIDRYQVRNFLGERVHTESFFAEETSRGVKYGGRMCVCMCESTFSRA